MAKKEDNRDIFDKIADYVAPAAGAALGGVAGRKLASKRTFKGDWAYKGHRAKPTKDLSDGLRKQADHIDYGGARVTRRGVDVSSEHSGKFRKQARQVDRMRAENVAITGAGAVGGAAVGYGAKEGLEPYEIRKRRK